MWASDICSVRTLLRKVQKLCQTFTTGLRSLTMPYSALVRWFRTLQCRRGQLLRVVDTLTLVTINDIFQSTDSQHCSIQNIHRTHSIRPNLNIMKPTMNSQRRRKDERCHHMSSCPARDVASNMRNTAVILSSNVQNVYACLDHDTPKSPKNNR